jgi:hypothetical protein
MTKRADDADSTLPRDEFSEALRKAQGHPEVVSSRSVVDLTDLLGNHVTWVVRTFRKDGQRTVLLEKMSADDPQRLVLPPAVVAAIGRQEETAVTHVRRRAARKAAATREVLGIRPAFLKAKDA